MFLFLVCNVEICSGIAWQKQSFREFFDHYDNYKKFSEMMLIATCCPTPEDVLVRRTWHMDNGRCRYWLHSSQ
jgi:hypothetical protein